MTHVRVKPAREGENLVHPLDGALAADGGLWRRDQFTFKRLRDGDVVEIDENGAPVSAPNGAGEAPPTPPAKSRSAPSQSTGPSAADASKE